MRSARSLLIWLCASAAAFASAACSGGNNNGDGSMQTDGGNNHMDGQGTDGTVIGPDGEVIDVSHVTGTWTTATSGTTEDTKAIWGSGANDIYAVTSRTVLHYTGSSWAGTPSMYVLAGVGGSGPADVWTIAITIPPAGSGEMGVLVMQHETGGGFMDSMPALMPYLGALSFSGAGNGWAVGVMGAAAHWDGSAWTASMNGLDNSTLSGVFTIGPTDAVAVGEKVWRWNGSSWAMQPIVNTTQTHNFNAVWASGANDVWAVGQYGFIQHWNGTAWVDSDPGNDAAGGVLSTDLFAVWGAAPNDIWAVGDAGTIIHYNGAAWSLIAGGGGSGPTTQGLHGVWGSAGNDVWAVGDHGTILHYH